MKWHENGAEALAPLLPHVLCLKSMKSHFAPTDLSPLKSIANPIIIRCSAQQTSNQDDSQQHVENDNESTTAATDTTTDNLDPDWEILNSELLSEDENDGLNDGEWLTDREKAYLRKQEARNIYAEKILQQHESPVIQNTTDPLQKVSLERPSAYTDEEEDVIAAMGGKTRQRQQRREIGFLGDSTLEEIATDYSVPISYIADVLTVWGVPVPINTKDQLGNLVTGEQAFALLEAVNSLDVSQLHDRYSNSSILNLCMDWDIDLRAAFELCMKEGWSLPFGVRTCLRIEQEDELLRVLGDQGGLDFSSYEEEVDEVD